ncbi:TWiK family of potassium channels protein 12-like [Hetaerina americana]|uniref:TWiK family of potassium channels protein 12-like n=1 Tax=Hetaerina americana TaxID=62018 RepID=UPI003A7F4498
MASSGGEVEGDPPPERDDQGGGGEEKKEEEKDAKKVEAGEVKKEEEVSSPPVRRSESGEEGSPRRPPERKERTARRSAKKEVFQDAKSVAADEAKEGTAQPPGPAPPPGVVASAPPPATEEAAPSGPTPAATDGDGAKVARRRKVPGSKETPKRRPKSRDDPDRRPAPPPEEGGVEEGGVVAAAPKKEEGRLKAWLGAMKQLSTHWRAFLAEETVQRDKIRAQRNRCVGSFMILIAYVGMGGIVFRFTEGAFETFYKCGVKRVKRDFVDGLWSDARSLAEDEWKSRARRRLMELEGQLHAAYDAGVTSYSGQRAWSFLNAVVYCLTVVTTIGYGHIAPATTTGRAITIAYAILGIPMFLILLADFGKLFTRGIKFLWAFVRRVYYTGSCKKVRRTGPVQEVMKGVQLVYDFATFRRPSQVVDGNGGPVEEGKDVKMTSSQSVGVTLASPEGSASQGSIPVGTISMTSATPDSVKMGKSLSAGPVFAPAGNDPGTPALSSFEVDDEFNLPISVAIFILLLYIFFGATIYYSWEEWGFFESFYFVFISMSTIGFGDYVPQHPMYMMASIIYLVFGLALTSMCINVVQEKLSDSFRQASVKLGATMGLQVTEEEAAMAAQKVELAEVHSAGKKPN